MFSENWPKEKFYTHFIEEKLFRMSSYRVRKALPSNIVCMFLLSPFPPPPCLCGLVTTNNTRVPLKQISIEANVYGFFADISTNLTYVNEGEEPMEVQFVFPTDAKSALYNMTSHCEHTITGEIKEKKEEQSKVILK